MDDEDLSPGFVLTSVHKPVHAVRQFEAQLAILEHKNIICAGYAAVMHIHTLAEEVTLAVSLLRSSVGNRCLNDGRDALIQALLHYFDKATGRKSRKPPQFAKRGASSLPSLSPSPRVPTHFVLPPPTHSPTNPLERAKK